ncbi:MAG: class I SAM-dependent methyltransferase [Saprospiraceae bacterium]|nr:class I SAM-dependent methyltransferase [Saprospiraceae bacterium]
MHQLSSLLGNTDIYLLDQILKGRYTPPEIILDAGAGSGRNLHWFARQGFEVYGTDRNPEAVEVLKQNYPVLPEDRFRVAPVEAMPFEDGFFHHIVCCAVLHFAENEVHFGQMFGELVRVLKPGGSMFFRVATDVGLAHKMVPLGDGRFSMPDGSDRFLLTRPALDDLLHKHRLNLLEPFKTVLVDDLRSMGVVVVGKWS